jgi:hypothetical protein
MQQEESQNKEETLTNQIIDLLKGHTYSDARNALKKTERKIEILATIN